MATGSATRVDLDGGARASPDHGRGAVAELRGPAQASLQREAFDAFPYGQLVLDHEGRIVCANRSAARLIESLGLSEGDLSCCSVLGCRAPRTALEAGCVTELALRQDRPLAEVRVELCTSQGLCAMWVAAAPLGDDRRRVVLQLRPGLVGDRRKATDPDWIAGPRLSIRTLGTTFVESTTGPIGGPWLDQRAGQLLKYLVAERRRAVSVDEIGESILASADYAVGTSVRYHVHALRRKLEPERGLREASAYIVARSGSYRLDLEHVAVDADEFERYVTAGLELADSDPQTGGEKLERGLAMYRGEFLAELPYTEWALPERHRLHDLACIALRRLADIRLECGAPDGATRALERLAGLQPFDEDVHRRLMEVDIARGRRSDAVRRYETLRSRMRRTFGQDPEFTPADLARARV
ncbi:MAG TPA: BTAD domain-containing putative transcriptional regulator [Solirubrobacteraceae bacterium]|nr:BTAD domain-containing putative transcriptional regulator [Solirubrobacteraceae bacterium]